MITLGLALITYSQENSSMNLKGWMRLGGILAMLLTVAPMLAVAQEYGRDRTEQQRGTIRIDNDQRRAVHITIWTNRGRELGGGWRFRSGESAFLAVGERKIRVRSNYQIKVGNGSRRANIGDVGRFRNGVWYVNVQNLRRDQYPDRNDPDRDDPDQYPDRRAGPDYLR